MHKTGDKKYHVLKDTREQRGWTWNESDFCDGMTVGTLKTGDYTIKGFEDKLIIERKGSITEVAKNFTEERFEREMERLVNFPYAYVLLEFPITDVINYPQSSGLSPYAIKKIKVSGNYLLSKMAYYELQYGVRFHFCNNHANGYWFASNLFRRAVNGGIRIPE
jgi:hypothetical protein